MQANENTLGHLAARVSAGDPAAAAELREELQPYLRRVARRALRPAAAASVLTRRIRAAAEQLAPDDAQPERLAVPVARRLGEALLSRLQAAAGGHRMLETVCD